MSALLRRSLPGDEPGLRTLWQRVFGDSDALLDAFFTLLYRPGMAAVAQEEGLIVSAAYALELGGARYIYAVATLPSHRGRGYGKAVTLLAADGQSAYLCPAEPSLRAWYAREMGAAELGQRPRTDVAGALTPLTPEEYGRAREALLAGTPHAVYPPEVLRFFAAMGAFYRTETGVCAIGEDGVVREALPGRGEGAFLMGLNGAPPLYLGLVLD